MENHNFVIDDPDEAIAIARWVKNWQAILTANNTGSYGTIVDFGGQEIS